MGAALKAAEEPRVFSKAEAVQRALSQNYQLRAARLQIQRAQSRTIDAGALPNPALNASGASDFAFGNEGQYNWTVGLSQAFPVTGRLRMLRSIAGREVELALVEVRQAELDLAYKIETTYDSLSALESKLELMDAQLELNRRFEAFLKKRLDRAEASGLDVRQVQVSIAALEQEKIHAHHLYEESLAALRILLGMDFSEEITVVTDSDFVPAVLPETSRSDLSHLPSYTLKQKLASLAEERTGLALAERWADITVSVFFQESYMIDQPVGFDKERLLGVGFSIPLPIHNQNRSEVESYRVHQRQLELELQGMGHQLLSEAKIMRERYADAQEQIRIYQSDVLELARANEAEMGEAYAAGQVSLTDVFRVQERLLELRMNFVELQSERATLYTQWRYLTAESLSPIVNENN